ncbi:MAG TPA: S9 family peptidase [Candidatus Polarisedimenticolia bacterium]|nr:S9 family peptidase [Candidatus Polarisedimenticolia bacterium]
MRRRSVRFALFVLCAAVTALAALPGFAADAAAQARRISLDDLGAIVRLSDPQISPDGRSIVILVARANYDDNRYDSELVLVDVATGSQRVLTRDRKQLAHPRWSPGGDRLAFLAQAAPKPKSKPKGDVAKDAARPAEPAPEPTEPVRQILILPMTGGDAQVLTAAPEGVQQFAWRPDGGAIAYVTEDEPADRAALTRGEDAFEVGNSDYMAMAAARPSHIWLIGAEGGEAKRLTSGAWSLPANEPPSSPSSPLSWSPDGKSIAFVRQEKPHFGDSDRTAVMVLDVASGATRPVTGRTEFESMPTYSPDGTKIAFWYPRDGDPNQVNEIQIAPAAGGEGKSITRGIDRCLYQSRFMPDGRSILTGGNDGGRVSLWLQPLEGAARKLSLGPVNPAWSFWVDAAIGKGGMIAFIGNESQHPSELYVMPNADTAPRRLTAFNDAVAALDLGKVETIEWSGPDGFTENGVLIYPPGFDRTRKYPLALVVHGGPAAASTEAFSAFGQILAARGWVIFQPNYRGSDNLGNAYQKAIVGDAGDGPGRDVMAGVEAVKAKGFVDAGKIGVSGWSYGGYMTSWLIGHYDVWKAAVSGASVTDLVDQYDLADFNVQERHIFAGRSPYVGDAMAEYRAQSPITYIPKAKAPTLVLSTTGDIRVPVTQSYRLYHALKDNGVETKFVAFPTGGHFPSDPVRGRAVYRHWMDWLADRLGTGDPAPTLPDGLRPSGTTAPAGAASAPGNGRD